MPDTNRARTILIREDTPLPANLPIESEAFLPGWRAVRNLDGYELGRKIEEAGWNFFYLAGEIGAIALGREGLGTLRRAVKRILAKQEGQKFNSLEVTEIISKRFLGIPFMSVTAHSRHIQQGIGLNLAKDLVLRIPAAPIGKMAKRQHTALIASS
jgi:hypothetical protein